MRFRRAAIVTGIVFGALLSLAIAGTVAGRAYWRGAAFVVQAVADRLLVEAA
jgi:hypothetical protein